MTERWIIAMNDGFQLFVRQERDGNVVDREDGNSNGWFSTKAEALAKVAADLSMTRDAVQTELTRARRMLRRSRPKGSLT